MSIVSALSIFTAGYLLIIPAYFFLRLIHCFRLSSASELRLHYFALSLVVVLSASQLFFPKSFVYQPTVKVFTAFNDAKTKVHSDYIDVGYGKQSAKIEARKMTAIWWFLGMMIVGFSLSRVVSDFWRLRTFRQRAFMIRQIGRVRVLVSNQIFVPFSYQTLFFAYVVIPTGMLTKRHDFRIALAHEIQHHRQGDTAWIYLIWFLKTVFVIQPIFYFWHRWLLELQEFACDEALLDHGRVSSHDYARCLVETAETAFYQERPPACATGLMFLVERHLISRRIEKMYSQKVLQRSRSFGFGAIVALSLAMTATAYASKGLVQDRRVSMADAQAMVKQASAKTDFPIVVNDLVLNELNHYIGTEDGRDYMRKALARMETYKPSIVATLNQYGLPMELLAIPIVESQYENLTEDGIHGHGAGLWMFIRPTARHFGLKVDQGVDERLNVDLETEAGARYLGANNLLFNDWLLAIFAYNVGENSVQKAIETIGSRDAWTLIKKGYENDERYLAKVMAAILIMKNPDSVK